jgi:hypothetical protein
MAGKRSGRRLRQRDQEGRLPHRQVLRLLAEPSEACGAHAFQIATEGGQGQVELQHFVLAEVQVELERASHLQEFGGERSFARLHQAGDLHGDGGTAGDDPRFHGHLVGGAEHSERIDTRVFAEALVFPRQRHAQVTCVDLFGIHRQAPFAVARDEGSKQRAVGCGYHDGTVVSARATDWVQTVDDGEREGKADERENGDDRRGAGPRTKPTT